MPALSPIDHTLGTLLKQSVLPLRPFEQYGPTIDTRVLLTERGDKRCREICAPARLVALQELVRTKIEARRSRYGKHPRELDRRLADIDRRIENYYRAIGDGLDATTCRQHIARPETEKGEVHAEAELLRQDDYYRRALQLNLTELERFAAAFGDDFRTLPMATQRRVLLHFIDEIRVVDREVVRVKVPFDDNGIRHLTNEVLMPEFPWPPSWDKRSATTSLPGPDLIGFLGNEGSERFLFGEVKSPDADDVHASVINGNDGLRQQIERLLSSEDRRQLLISWLWVRSRGRDWQPKFDRCLAVYLANPSQGVGGGVLMRGRDPNEADFQPVRSAVENRACPRSGWTGATVPERRAA